jgi:hypothetical protein
MLRARLTLLVGCSASLLFAAACGDDGTLSRSGLVDDDAETGRPRPDAGDTGEDTSLEACDLELTAPGGTTVGVLTGANASLSVRLADCEGIPVPSGTLVGFTAQGETGGTALMARSAATDDDGMAVVTLNAGFSEVAFEVLVEAEGAEPLTLHVTVSANPSGFITVTLTVPGPLTFDGFTPYLYAASSCALLGPYERPAAMLEGATVTSPASRPTLAGVPIGTDYVVIVLADKDRGLRGYGCADALAVLGGRETEAEVVIGELPIVFTGVYGLDNRLDLSGSLPPSVATTLQIFDEMTDDNSLRGNHATQDYGLDPAAFLLDFVYRQFCCWEAVGANPSWSSCRAQSFQHPWGDLSLLYIKDFMSWSGAQPVFFGMCGGLEFGNEAVMELVQDFILDSVPGVVLNLLQMAGDLSRAFTDMHLTSELTVAEAYLTKDSNFTHELQTMIVELHDMQGALHVFEFELRQAGLTNLAYTGETSVTDGHVLVIPEHSFRLDFGRLLLYVYRNGLLPLLDCDADRNGVTEPCTSTADLFRTWVDCSAVGVWLYENISDWISVATYQGYCDTGLTLAGLYVEGEIQSSIERQTVITLSGTAAAGELDGRRRALELIGGVWDGTLVEDDAEIGIFDGTFSGQRTGEVR